MRTMLALLRSTLALLWGSPAARAQDAYKAGATFIGNRMGQDRAVWGTNGLPWKESLDQVDGLGLRDEARQKLLHHNARELFKI